MKLNRLNKSSAAPTISEVLLRNTLRNQPGIASIHPARKVSLLVQKGRT